MNLQKDGTARPDEGECDKRIYDFTSELYIKNPPKKSDRQINCTELIWSDSYVQKRRLRGKRNMARQSVDISSRKGLG